MKVRALLRVRMRMCLRRRVRALDDDPTFPLVEGDVCWDKLGAQPDDRTEVIRGPRGTKGPLAHAPSQQRHNDLVGQMQVEGG